MKKLLVSLLIALSSCTISEKTQTDEKPSAPLNIPSENIAPQNVLLDAEVLSFSEGSGKTDLVIKVIEVIQIGSAVLPLTSGEDIKAFLFNDQIHNFSPELLTENQNYKILLESPKSNENNQWKILSLFKR